MTLQEQINELKQEITEIEAVICFRTSMIYDLIEDCEELDQLHSEAIVALKKLQGEQKLDTILVLCHTGK
jgi:hypothetical protein